MSAFQQIYKIKAYNNTKTPTQVISVHNFSTRIYIESQQVGILKRVRTTA